MLDSFAVNTDLDMEQNYAIRNQGIRTNRISDPVGTQGIQHGSQGHHNFCMHHKEALLSTLKHWGHGKTQPKGMTSQGSILLHSEQMSLINNQVMKKKNVNPLKLRRNIEENKDSQKVVSYRRNFEVQMWEEFL